MSNFGGTNHVTTRKPHSCIFCNRAIPVKSNAYNYRGMWEDNWQNWYSCEICQTNDDISGDSSEGISGDEFRDWVYEQDFADCPKCKATYSEIDFEWSKDETTLLFECSDCEEKWEKFIGFEVKKGGEQ